jgi:hypothetical protein
MCCLPRNDVAAAKRTVARASASPLPRVLRVMPEPPCRPRPRPARARRPSSPIAQYACYRVWIRGWPRRSRGRPSAAHAPPRRPHQGFHRPAASRRVWRLTTCRLCPRRASALPIGRDRERRPASRSLSREPAVHDQDVAGLIEAESSRCAWRTAASPGKSVSRRGSGCAARRPLGAFAADAAVAAWAADHRSSS